MKKIELHTMGVMSPPQEQKFTGAPFRVFLGGGDDCVCVWECVNFSGAYPDQVLTDASVASS